MRRAENATAPVLALPGPLKEGGPLLAPVTWDANATTDGRHRLTHPTGNTLQMFRGGFGVKI